MALRFYPCLTDLAFALPAVLLLFVLPGGASRLLFDGDTGWHIRTGDWILAHRAIPRVDFFSFTKPGQPWFAWEWGWDVLAAMIHRSWGLSGLVFCNVVILCLVSALLFRLIRKVSDHDLLALAFTAAAMCASIIHWLARPHLLAWLFFLILLHVLWDAEHGKTRHLLLLPPLVLVWTDIHASFFIGMVLVTLSAGGQWITGGWRQSRPFWICSLLCAGVTLANPYGWHVHAHIVDYLANGKLLDQIQEFQSLDFHRFPATIVEAFLLPLGAVIVWCVRRKLWAAAAAILLWAHFALVSARNIPFFVFVASPFAAAWIAEWIQTIEPKGIWSRLRSAISEVNSQLTAFDRVTRVYAPSALLLFGCAVCFAANQTRPASESPFSVDFPKSFPAQVLPVIQHTSASHIFTTDQWSDFLIYRLFPSTTIFVDGRSDFFGPELVGWARQILQAHWDWNLQLSRFSADMVIVPPDAPLATALKRSPGWHPLFDDGSAIVFARSGGAGSHGGKVSAVARNGGRKLGS